MCGNAFLFAMQQANSPIAQAYRSFVCQSVCPPHRHAGDLCHSGLTHPQILPDRDNLQYVSHRKTPGTEMSSVVPKRHTRQCSMRRSNFNFNARAAATENDRSSNMLTQREARTQIRRRESTSSDVRRVSGAVTRTARVNETRKRYSCAGNEIFTVLFVFARCHN